MEGILTVRVVLKLYKRNIKFESYKFSYIRMLGNLVKKIQSK